MKKKSKPQKVETMKFFLYRGFFHCAECGYTITADKKIKKSGKEYIYYYCTKKNPHHKCTQNVFTREEKISSQIKIELQKVSLPDDCADWMITELKKERIQSSQSSDFFVQKLQKELSKLDEKLEKLMNAYLESVLNITEYQKAKNVLINQKQVLKDKLNAFELKSNNRFELADKFIKDSKQAKIIASKENPEGIRDFLKKIGSNFRLINQNLFFDFKNPYKIIADYEPEHREGEVINPENPKFVAWRRERDSNPRYLSVYTLSKHAHSATMRPLH